MARILVVDGNPENVKSLEGLLRYRTRHEFECVGTQQEGARKAISLSPDLIMMNALLFMKKNYAFPRVLQQHEKTKNITFLVHANGHLDDVTVKQIQASGVAKMIFLPASTQELEEGIDEALALSTPQTQADVAPVAWRQASSTEIKKTVRPYSKKKKSAQSVAWPRVSANQDRVQKPRQKTGRQERKVSREPEKVKGFRSASFEQVDDVPTEGKAKFKQIVWEKIDPKKLKKRQ